MLRSIKMAGSSTEKETREKLLRVVKKEVKQIMEEAVTRKFVHEGSSTVTSLCGAVEACLSHGLRRRALGLFKTNSTTALLHKVAKHFEPASAISVLVQEFENADPNKTSSTSGDSTVKPNKKLQTTSTCTVRYLWIRLALFEKQLARIIDFLVQNSSKYYEKDALVADPVDGPILASLLVGPCALDYSKMKTQDHLWTDLPADELVQRHRISGAYHPNLTTPPSGRRPGLQFRRPVSSGASEDGFRMLPITARDYVELLHQNSRATLLYGKNNVMVQPQKDNVDLIPGYLSLHQTADHLTIKWTPNQLMNGCYNDGNADRLSKDDKSIFWEYALNVVVDEIVYVHCHQQAECGGTIVLVGQDGVQRPPIHFPKGGHLLAFLSCLENGLLPHGQLDPPLWSQRGRGKVFPKLRRRGKGSPAPKEDSFSIDDEEETADYVFRIVNSVKPTTISQEMMDPKASRSGMYPWTVARERKKSALQHGSTHSSSSNSSAKSLSLTEEYAELQRHANIASGLAMEQTGDSLQVLCDTMKRQIISRAFYGWLAYCRHLRTVRTHLSGLVNMVNVSVDEPCDASTGLTADVWDRIQNSSDVIDPMEIYRLIYFGGIQHEIRKEVWPYLLGHYQFGSAPEERAAHDEEVRQVYETTMSEWLAVEAIVRQRDKENVAAQIAKLSSESTNGEIPLIGKDHTLSNEVFEDSGSEDEDDNPDSKEDDNPDSKEEESYTEMKNSDARRAVLEQGSTEGEKLEFVPDEYSSLESGVSKDLEVVEESTSGFVKSTDTSGDVTELAEDMIDEHRGILVRGDTGDEKDVDESQQPEGSELQDDQLFHDVVVREPRSTCLSPASSSGGVYSVELLDSFGLNLHRIDKDVQRCDRNYWYFTPSNLEKLRNVMCTYVWEQLDIGYVQGMCDLVAPLLVIFDDEAKTYSCFCELMKRMSANFPHGGAMDSHFANMRSLIQILDSEMLELMHQNGDYTHFYFCYRWFLLDFKRELVYDDVFSVWETIWAAKHVASNHFVLFIALALVEFYRDVILDNNMDFTDIIKFFNEMAERHNAKAILKVARELVLQLQTLIDNK